MDSLFTRPDTWTGGFYELAMEFHPAAKAGLDAGVTAIWQSDGLEGCYLRRDVEPGHQQRICPTLKAMSEHCHLLGIATVPGERRVACGTILIEESTGPIWLIFYLPMGALGTAYDVKAFPLDGVSESRTWREPLDKWLAAIGQRVYSEARFRLGLVGHEVAAWSRFDAVAEQGPPPQRWIGYLYPRDDGLQWLPPNQWKDSQPGKVVSVPFP